MAGPMVAIAGAGADEQARADDPADGDHRHVSLPKVLARPVVAGAAPLSDCMGAEALRGDRGWPKD